jgi:hypothetical protein
VVERIGSLVYVHLGVCVDWTGGVLCVCCILGILAWRFVYAIFCEDDGGGSALYLSVCSAARFPALPFHLVCFEHIDGEHVILTRFSTAVCS